MINTVERLPIIRQEEPNSGQNESKIYTITFIYRWWQVAETIRESEVIGSPRLPQLDVTSAEIFIHRFNVNKRDVTYSFYSEQITATT